MGDNNSVESAICRSPGAACRMAGYTKARRGVAAVRGEDERRSRRDAWKEAWRQWDEAFVFVSFFLFQTHNLAFLPPFSAGVRQPTGIISAAASGFNWLSVDNELASWLQWMEPIAAPSSAATLEPRNQDSFSGCDYKDATFQKRFAVESIHVLEMYCSIWDGSPPTERA